MQRSEANINVFSNLDSKRSFTNNNVELYTMENDGKLNVPRGTIHVKKDFDIHEVRTP